MATFVLVHGGFTDGRYWGATADALQSAGHHAVVAELPSTGPDPQALGGVADDVAEVRRLIDAAAEPVVLVGHSYGGLVLTEAADHPGIARSVYVGAFWPERGQVLGELMGGGPPDWMRVDGTGAGLGVTEDAEQARQALAADVDPETWAAWHAALIWSPMAGFGAVAQAPDRTHPVTYVVLGRDRALPTEVQELMAHRADDVERLDTSHSPQHADPVGLAAVLARAAPRSGGGPDGTPAPGHLRSASSAG